MADEESPKIGAGHLSAMGRQGLKELAQALPAFPSAGIQPVEEPGLVGNLTPMEVAKDKGAYETLLDQYAARGNEQEQQKTNEMER